VDEAGIDNRADYPWGWSARGQRFLALKSGHRRQRISFIAALRDRDLIAPMTFEGTGDHTVFIAWLQHMLIPQLQPGQTVTLDNARFHQSPQITASLSTAGCHLRYLPAYSPDLNPIEHRWASLKNTIRKNIPRYPSLQEAIDAAFIEKS